MTEYEYEQEQNEKEKREREELLKYIEDYVDLSHKTVLEEAERLMEELEKIQKTYQHWDNEGLLKRDVYNQFWELFNDLKRKF